MHLTDKRNIQLPNDVNGNTNDVWESICIGSDIFFLHLPLLFRHWDFATSPQDVEFILDLLQVNFLIFILSLSCREKRYLRTMRLIKNTTGGQIVLRFFYV